nr:ATP-binding protein [Ferrovum myxofaciens]
MNRLLLTPFGLKWNPFNTELPTEALYLSPKINDFFWRIEQVHVREGGFALIQGDPGTGKSVALRALAERLERQTDLTVGILNHPQSNLGDFYRELAEVFGVMLKPCNRWGGFKILRERWISHLEATRTRCCLLIDEAQEMSPKTLLELRLLASARFDSQPLLAVVLAGDARLNEALTQGRTVAAGYPYPGSPDSGLRHAGRIGRLPGSPARQRRSSHSDEPEPQTYLVRTSRGKLSAPDQPGCTTPGCGRTTPTTRTG